MNELREIAELKAKLRKLATRWRSERAHTYASEKGF